MRIKGQFVVMDQFEGVSKTSGRPYKFQNLLDLSKTGNGNVSISVGGTPFSFDGIPPEPVTLAFDVRVGRGNFLTLASQPSIVNDPK